MEGVMAPYCYKGVTKNAKKHVSAGSAVSFEPSKNIVGFALLSVGSVM